MKVLLLIDTFGAGGAERSTLELARYLIGLPDITVAVAALKKKPVGIEEQFLALPCSVTIGDTRNRKERFRFIDRLIREERPDLVHTVVFETNLLTRLVWQRRRNFILVQSLVNTPYIKEREVGTGLRKLKFELAKLSDIVSARATPIHYHAITESVVDHYRSLFGIGTDDYEVIHRGRLLNPHAPEPARQRFAPSAARPLRLVNVGRQEFQKGQWLILEALQLLKEQHGITDIELNVYGRQGAMSERIEGLLTEFQLQEQVTLHPFTNNIYASIAKDDVFVFPSYFEGLGGALVEAMATGLPCICSDIAVLREVIGSDRGAEFFTAGDAGSLAGAILRVYRDPERRVELAEHVRARFAAAFQLETISRQMADMYRRLIATPN